MNVPTQAKTGLEWATRLRRLYPKPFSDVVPGQYRVSKFIGVWIKRHHERAVNESDVLKRHRAAIVGYSGTFKYDIPPVRSVQRLGSAGETRVLYKVFGTFESW